MCIRDSGKTADLIFIEQWEKKPTVYSTVNFDNSIRTVVDGNNDPVANGDKVANGTVLTITPNVAAGQNEALVVEANGTAVTPDGTGAYKYTVTGNTVLSAKVVAQKITVDLVMNQKAIVEIDGVKYTSDANIDLAAGVHDFKVTYATNVPAYLQGETGDAKVTVDDFGGGTKRCV